MKLVDEFISSEDIYQGRVVKLRVDTVMLPDGRISQREVIAHPGAVAIVPLLPDGKVVMVRQYRRAADAILLEIPAGTLEVGEDPEDCAYRELSEETGYRTGSMVKLFQQYLAPGYSSELLHVYLADRLVAGHQSFDDDETIELAIIALSDVPEHIKQGVIADAKSIAALMMVIYLKSQE